MYFREREREHTGEKNRGGERASERERESQAGSTLSVALSHNAGIMT